MKKTYLAASVVLALSAAKEHDGVIHFLSDLVSVDAGFANKLTTVTITRTGRFYDKRYGDFELTQQMFESIIKNFDENVYGQDINIDIAHKPEDGAAGVIRKLFIDAGRLRAEVQWYELGVNKIKKEGFKYLSAEIHPNFVSNEVDDEGNRKAFGPTLLGSGLVIRPCIKNLDKIELSEESLHSCPTYLSETLAQKFSEERTIMWKQLIALFKKNITGLKLSASQHDAMVKLFTDSIVGVSEEGAAKKLQEQIETVAKQLSESSTQEAPVINLNGGGLSQEDVVRILSEQQELASTAAKEHGDKLSAKVKLFNDAIEAAEGLCDDVKKTLKEASILITADMSEDQVTKLAENQISHGNKEMVSIQLSGLGFNGGPVGSTGQTPDQQRESLQLQAQIHSALRQTPSFSMGQLMLSEETVLPAFCVRVLNEFDRLNHHKLHQERLVLSGQNTGSSMSDSQLPVSVQREVIREALSDLNVLSLVQTLTDFTAQATTSIPYEKRDVTALLGDGIVFENGTIPKVKNSQAMDLAYVLPMKVAFEVSNELMHFSRSSQINWDAWGRNVATAARIIKELISRRIVNTMQRVADSYLAATASDNIAIQLQGTAKFKTTHFPVVAQFQQFDLQGNTIGGVENSIVLSINGKEVRPYDGSGKQPAGLYYVVASYNLGQFILVNEHAEIALINAEAAMISYSYATNIQKIDSDVPDGMAPEKHYNSLLQSIGRRKAIMKDDRFVTPDFLLMSHTLNDTCTNAESFVSSKKRAGTSTTAQGDLDMVKSMPAFSTNAPGTHLGDERIIMGQRGALSYTVVKPYTLSEMQEARDENGQLKGGKEAYGEEYNAIHCPKPIRNRFTSVLFYSGSSR